MIIANNAVSNKLYVSLNRNLDELSKTAEQLATGQKLPKASYGAGLMALADRIQRTYRGQSTLIDSMSNYEGFASLQESVLNDSKNILLRMSELAASALDSSKSAADRTALDTEFQLINDEILTLANITKYNGVSVFNNSQEFRIGLGVSEVLTFVGVSLQQISVTGGLTTIAAASAALGTISVELASLNVFMSRVGSYKNRLSRTMNSARELVSSYQNAESAIRDVDVASQTSKFINQQMKLQASQAVIAQSNRLTQQAAIFFQF